MVRWSSKNGHQKGIMCLKEIGLLLCSHLGRYHTSGRQPCLPHAIGPLQTLLTTPAVASSAARWCGLKGRQGAATRGNPLVRPGTVGHVRSGQELASPAANLPTCSEITGTLRPWPAPAARMAGCSGRRWPASPEPSRNPSLRGLPACH